MAACACRREGSTGLRAETEESIRIIRHGIDLGINYIDTAWPYHLGDSERIVGQALQDGYRERVHLVTKLFMPLVRETDDFDRYLNAQLEKLQTEYLDIYLFHAMNAGGLEKVKRLGLIEKMEEAKRQGRIRHIGFSFHDTFPVFKEIVDYYDWDMAQIQYNYMDTGIQATSDGLVYGHSKGIAMVIMEPLKGGQLANPPAEALEIMRRGGQRTHARRLGTAVPLEPARSGHGAQRHGQPADGRRELRQRRPLGHQLPEPGGRGGDRQAGRGLSPQDPGALHRLRVLHALSGRRQHPPELCHPEQRRPWSSSRIRRWQVRRGYGKLAGSKDRLDKENPNGNASLCIECGKCLEKCPQEINIPVELEKVHAILGKRGRISDHYP